MSYVSACVLVLLTITCSSALMQMQVRKRSSNWDNCEITLLW